MWKNGSTHGTTSSGPTPIARDWITFATRLVCVSITPLGLPVVPDEYGSTARCVAGSNDDVRRGVRLGQQVGQGRVPGATAESPSSTTSCSCARPAPSAPASPAASSGDTVIISRAPESTSCLVISEALARALTVVTVTPARSRPWNTVT